MNNSDRELPKVGSYVRCINNADRPELTIDQEYKVAFEKHIDKMPINYKRFQPDDYRFIAIDIPGWKETCIVPFGIFEIVK